MLKKSILSQMQLAAVAAAPACGGITHSKELSQTTSWSPCRQALPALKRQPADSASSHVRPSLLTALMRPATGSKPHKSAVPSSDVSNVGAFADDAQLALFCCQLSQGIADHHCRVSSGWGYDDEDDDTFGALGVSSCGQPQRSAAQPIPTSRSSFKETAPWWQGRVNHGQQASSSSLDPPCGGLGAASPSLPSPDSLLFLSAEDNDDDVTQGCTDLSYDDDKAGPRYGERDVPPTPPYGVTGTHVTGKTGSTDVPVVRAADLDGSSACCDSPEDELTCASFELPPGPLAAAARAGWGAWPPHHGGDGEWWTDQPPPSYRRRDAGSFTFDFLRAQPRAVSDDDDDVPLVASMSAWC